MKVTTHSCTGAVGGGGGASCQLMTWLFILLSLGFLLSKGVTPSAHRAAVRLA